MQNVDWISLLKLRAGWGQLGNNRIGNNAYATYVGQQSATYIYGVGMPTIQPGMSISSYGNSDILGNVLNRPVSDLILMFWIIVSLHRSIILLRIHTICWLLSLLSIRQGTLLLRCRMPEA